ncbi:MAG: hypothetical protein GWP61_13690 [Chloroflexi bacterium]|nr:hypothetical protein [Chloroflexota bacterium]
MIERPIWQIIYGLVLLTLTACLPQVAVEQVQLPLDTATHLPSLATFPPTATPTSTQPPTATPLPIQSRTTSPPATQPVKETTLPIDPTSPAPESAASQLTATSSDLETSQPSPEPALQPAIQGWVNQATEDLATRLKPSIPEIEFLSFEEKVWSDSSLGCPQPGMRYLQVLKEGYLIRLSANNQTYNYHGSGDRPPFLCQQPGPEISITKQPPPNIKQTPTISVPPPRD